MSSVTRPPDAPVAEGLHRVEQNAQLADQWVRRRGGWARVLRNTVVGYVEQAGSRMAAALSYYSIFVGGPMLLFTLVLGTAIFGEQATREAVTELVERVLPPGGGEASEVAQRMVRTSTPTASLALVAGLFSLLGFTRALATSVNVTLNLEGTETLRRTILVGPLLVVAVLGLLWGAWAFRILVEVLQASTGFATSALAEFLLGGVLPLLLAIVYFGIILTVVPRVQLSKSEVLLPAALGALLWETTRHVFGWLVKSGSGYLQVFGPLGGIVALLAWVYLSCAILVLVGQFTWAYAMERRGRGRSASYAPREASLQGWRRPFHGDNAVNEDVG
jgi:membrane protein